MGLVCVYMSLCQIAKIALLGIMNRRSTDHLNQKRGAAYADKHSKELPAYGKLREENIFVLAQERAVHQIFAPCVF